ncbi:hypothetical protein KUTeg_012729, partial [Tegillarca granosa]
MFYFYKSFKIIKYRDAFSVNGNWSEWSLWSFCSVNCTMIRSRTCTNPAPAYDGEQCSGNSTDESDCTPCT